MCATIEFRGPRVNRGFVNVACHTLPSPPHRCLPFLFTKEVLRLLLTENVCHDLLLGCTSLGTMLFGMHTGPSREHSFTFSPCIFLIRGIYYWITLDAAALKR